MTQPPKPGSGAKPLGPSLNRSEAELDRLAEISDADIIDSLDLWHDLAPRGYQGLIDAKPEPKAEG